MRQTSHAWYAVIAALAGGLVIPGKAPGQPLDQKDRIDFVVAEWKKRQSEVVNGRIEARAFRSGTIERLRPDEVKALFKGANLPNNKYAGMRDVVSRMTGGRLSGNTPWSQIKCLFEGTKAKEITEGNQKHYEHLRDGANVVRQNGPNKTVVIDRGDRSNEYIRTVDDFRYVPTGQVTALETAEQQSRLWVKCDDNSRVLIDTRTADVYEVVSADNRGLIHRIQLFDGYVDYPGQVRFPTVAMRVGFDGRVSNYCSLTVIDEAEFNTDLPSDAFAVGAKQGYNIIDRRQPSNLSSYLKVSEVSDALVYADTRGHVPVGGGRSRAIYIIIAICGIAGLIVASVIYLRRSRVKRGIA